MLFTIIMGQCCSNSSATIISKKKKKKKAHPNMLFGSYQEWDSPPEEISLKIMKKTNIYDDINSCLHH